MCRFNGCILVILSLSALIVIYGCGDVEPIKPEPPKELSAIEKVLKEKWIKGYMSEDVDLYMSAYWKEGFLYKSDVGTPSDPSDDVIFDDWRLERDSAIRIFKAFQNIEIEISEPPEIKILNPERTKAEVRNHYKIQAFVSGDTSLPGGYTGWFAEGDNTFTFEFKSGEWRITEWRDEAFSPEQIAATNA